ncbi:hypothetical protein WG219_02640 [Ectopseudomonas mendocina]|uniref:Uncharacterized protein n=1 Tax=Ectopseudomonas mendocina TaxID=300 RepID=A0ABZ2RQE0_ECTME
MAIVIATDDAGHAFVDGNDRGGAVAAEMGELDGLEAHGDFLVYSWPEKAFWLMAVGTQRRVQIGISPLFEEFVYLENLQWPDIVCDS